MISKCFLPKRRPEFLQQEYNNILCDYQKAEQFGSLMLLEKDSFVGREDRLSSESDPSEDDKMWFNKLDF